MPTEHSTRRTRAQSRDLWQAAGRRLPGLGAGRLTSGLCAAGGADFRGVRTGPWLTSGLQGVSGANFRGGSGTGLERDLKAGEYVAPEYPGRCGASASKYGQETGGLCW